MEFIKYQFLYQVEFWILFKNFLTVVREKGSKWHLSARSINKDWRTIVHTPKQNGTNERFWKTLESSIINYDSLQNFVKEYNSYLYHRSLSNLIGEKCTPDQAYSLMEKWNPDLPDILDF